MPVKTLVDACLLALWLAFAGWLFSFPVNVPSDDALFFSRGLMHFSVLEFSPHFPGYPGIVLLGRFLYGFTQDGVTALFWLSTLSAVTIPLVVAALIYQATHQRWLVRGGFVLALTQPLLPLLGLSLLSDAPGLLFFLLFWWGVVQRKALLAGVMLGISLACRPSYAPLWTGACVMLLWDYPALVRRVIMGALVMLIPVWGGIWAWEGNAYWQEGWRFFWGHVQLWGGTRLAQYDASTWFDAAQRFPGGACYALLLISLAGVGVWAGRHQSHCRWVGACLLTSLGWTLVLQNPDNLRHLAPVLLLAGAALPLALAQAKHPLRYRLGAIAIVTVALIGGGLGASAAIGAPRIAPLSAAVSVFSRMPPAVISTQQGVALLRKRLPQHQIYDAYYAAQTAHLIRYASLPVYRVSSSPQPASRLAFLSGRVWGEAGVGIYRLAPQ